MRITPALLSTSEDSRHDDGFERPHNLDHPRSPGPQPVAAASEDLWIFRDGKQKVCGKELLESLRRRVTDSLPAVEVVDALIEAGELEAALADAEWPSAPAAAEVTNALASFLCGRRSLTRAAELLSTLDVPSEVNISPPEGFTYYALNPGDFVRVLARIPSEPRACAIIGIRSIGTTLSAVVLAALLSEKRAATRITVRPTGHPYDRRTQFSAPQLAWIERNRGAHFLVVDEGPGRSGSTFLSVAEALVSAGVPAHNVTLLGSREPDVNSLCADQAARRWMQFRFVAASASANQRFKNYTYVGGGDWRKYLLQNQASWPESWTQMERLKFISPDRKHLYKFEGMGRIGDQSRSRAYALADAGFGPRVCDAGDGFLSYSLIAGKHLAPEAGDVQLLDRIAEYCAFRNSAFPSRSATSQLREMLQFNVSEEFGIDLSLPPGAFESEQCVIVDGRMQPHEWLATAERFIKTDGVDHGDNHFFPGPCDIAWDIAGAIVEWRLGERAAYYLLERFRLRSGVDVTDRLEFYLLGYLMFRLGFCKMAISTVKGSTEEFRLRAAYEDYRTQAYKLLRSFERDTAARQSA